MSRFFLRSFLALALLGAMLLYGQPAPAGIDGDKMLDVGPLNPLDSQLAVTVGQVAPDFRLPSVQGDTVTLSRYRGVSNVLLSFVPAAWTRVCSDQWPGYDLARELFEKHDTVLLGITVDNLPTLHAWVREMGGLWFPVLSDFWPHGAAAQSYGVLRSSGTSERALVLIDKAGIIRYIDVHDINQRPDLGILVREMEKLQSGGGQ